jgi:hypothetical protein
MLQYNINCNNLENYRKAIHVLQKCNFNFHTCENKQTRPIRVMAKDLHYSCKPENIMKSQSDGGFKIIKADN